jgi:hypothetical protein
MYVVFIVIVVESLALLCNHFGSLPTRLIFLFFKVLLSEIFLYIVLRFNEDFLYSKK